MADITFRKLTEHDYADFRDDVKRIFSIAVVEAFGKPKGDEEIIRDDEMYPCTTPNVRYWPYMLTAKGWEA